MEAYLSISYLNDFVFCPRSIYFHQLYGKVEQRLYQTTDQTEGKAAHKAVDEKTYSTSRHILQGAEVYSDKYKIGGKIDTFDIKKGVSVICPIPLFDGDGLWSKKYEVLQYGW